MRKHDDRMGKPDRDEDTAKVAGGVGGASGAAALGAGAGALLGPVGLVLGGLAGAVGGWWAGREAAEELGGFDRADDEYRRLHEQSDETAPYHEVRHAYQLGYLAGRNPEYQGKGFGTVEQDLRRAWDEAHGDTTPWDRVRPYVDRGYRGVGDR